MSLLTSAVTNIFTRLRFGDDCLICQRVFALRKISGGSRPRPDDGPALGRAANRRVDDDAREQSVHAIRRRGRF